MAAHDLLGLFTLIRFDTHTDELARGFDDGCVAEQTVLRLGVARSEHAGHTTTLRSRRHEENGTIASLRLGLAIL